MRTLGGQIKAITAPVGCGECVRMDSPDGIGQESGGSLLLETGNKIVLEEEEL